LAATGACFDPARSDLDFVVAFEPMTQADYADAFLACAKHLPNYPAGQSTS